MDTNDELASYLDALARDDCYRVDAVLKDSALETTERVFFRGENGSELGPFVRKRIRGESGLGGAYEEVFSAQARGVRLAHLPRLLECHRRDGDLVVVMELVPGQTLAEHVEACKGPAARLELSRRVFPELCDAVSELHERLGPPVIHRDLKPSNVMVSEGGVTLIDLGIARSYRAGAEQDTTHFGTRSYAPPEQFGFGQTGVTSDVFALGMMLFFCVTGREPGTADREAGFTAAGVPEALRAVIVWATQLDPAARFATARELRDAFLATQGAAGSVAATELEPPTFESSHRFRLAIPGLPESWGSAGRWAWLGRVPARAGVAWNVLVLCGLAIVLAGCVVAYVRPMPSVSSYPRWLQAASYLVVMPIMALTCGYLLLDRRPLRRRVPALAGLTVRQEVRWGLRVLLGVFLAWVVLLGVGVSG
ncbi:serine/threonine-protein kinase [Olsenella sp. An293]|uniref:serine/threonine-protein kinase n=1 Tax=Olsenella sp. An293 TaxID=1965626 RepID=UPI000B389817|nr:serine/threonine-protein kinase [Olsenella sp. An293]OUO32051.1 hypothetical protein B5F85_07845 [Olsenella sp. An293]